MAHRPLLITTYEAPEFLAPPCSLSRTDGRIPQTVVKLGKIQTCNLTPPCSVPRTDGRNPQTVVKPRKYKTETLTPPCSLSPTDGRNPQTVVKPGLLTSGVAHRRNSRSHERPVGKQGKRGKSGKYTMENPIPLSPMCLHLAGVPGTWHGERRSLRAPRRPLGPSPPPSPNRRPTSHPVWRLRKNQRSPDRVSKLAPPPPNHSVHTTEERR